VYGRCGFCIRYTLIESEIEEEEEEEEEENKRRKKGGYTDS
jgi:hypothetical protein